MQIKIIKTHQRYFSYNDLKTLREGEILILPANEAEKFIADGYAELYQGEKKMDNRIIENKAILNSFNNKEDKVEAEEPKKEISLEKDEVLEDPKEEESKELSLEELKKLADEKGIDYHPNIGINKLKKRLEKGE